MRKNGWLEPMSSVDSFWYSMDESTNLMIITAVMEFDEVVEYARLQDLLEKRLLLYKRFRQRIVWPATRMGLPFWDYDPNFDIRNHIVKLALPSPGDKKALARMISDLSIVPLDREKPLWQMHIIENYGTGSVVLLRIHHAIADGIAMVRLLFSLSDLRPNGDDAGCAKKTESCSNPRKPKTKNKIEMLRSTLNLLFRTGELSVMKSLNMTEFIQKELMKTLAHPSYITQFSKNVSRIGLTFAAALYQLAFMSEDKRTSLKGRIGTQKSVFWSEPIALDKVRETAKFYRCTVNDVVMTAVTGALRNYCLLRGDDLTEAEARFAVPVKVGSKSPNVALGNKFSLVFLHLPLHMDDRAQRLRELRKRIRAAKHSAEAFVGYQAMRVLGLPPKRITKMGASFFSRKLTGVLASVPGPQAPLYFTDLPIRNVMFWVPRIGNLGLGISIFSYAASVTLGIAVDSSLLPEPEKITGFFEKELDQMHRGVREKKEHEETRRKTERSLRAYG